MVEVTSFRRQKSFWLFGASRELSFRRSRVTSLFLLVGGLMVWSAFVSVDVSLSGDGTLATDSNLRLILEANISSPSSEAVRLPEKDVKRKYVVSRRGPQPAMKASELPDASDWTPSKETPYQVCFLTSVYAASADTSDRPPDIRDIQEANPSFRFFAFTNFQNLDAPGWKIKVQNFPSYRRYITQSRWAKFMGWKDPEVQGCQAVFFMDGFCGPKMKHSERYKRLAKAIYQSEFGLFQNEHDIAVGPLDELDRILERHKDIAKNVEASKAWLNAQPDFSPDATIYANHYIGYNPKSPYFQKAAEFFWNRYSSEEDSWRDQPLWAYALDRFHITPTRLGTFDALFKEYFKRMGHAGHRYNAAADSNAAPRQE